MTKEEQMQLILLIFSESEEDFRLGENMIHNSDMTNPELDSFVKQCCNLVVINKDKSNRIQHLIASLSKKYLENENSIQAGLLTSEYWMNMFNNVVREISRETTEAKYNEFDRFVEAYRRHVKKIC